MTGWTASITLCPEHWLTLSPAEARRVAESCPSCTVEGGKLLSGPCYLLVPVSGPIIAIPHPGPAEEYDVLSGAVGGDIEAVGFDLGLTMWLNEEGKLDGLPHNPRAQVLWDARFGAGTDYLVGPIVLTGGTDDEGATIALDPAVAFGLMTRLGA